MSKQDKPSYIQVLGLDRVIQTPEGKMSIRECITRGAELSDEINPETVSGFMRKCAITKSFQLMKKQAD